MSLDSSHKALLAEWKKNEKRDLNVVNSLLQNIQASLNNPSVYGSLSDADLDKIHQDFLEIKALYTVLTNDMKGFREAIAKVHGFYGSVDVESEQKYLMFGLHLMFLLASNELSEFHLLLEQIDMNVQTSDPLIITPIKLEQFLMEGAYNKVILNEKTIPSVFYTVFIRVMADAVRKEIALCMEKSYYRLLVRDAAMMLLYDKQADVLAYAEKRGWKLEKDEFCFDAANAIYADQGKAILDTDRVVKQNLFYANQIEMII